VQLIHPEIIVALMAAAARLRVHVRRHARDARGCMLADREPMPELRGQLLLVPGAGRHAASLGALGLLGDDVDDAVHGVGAPEGRAGAPDHLDPLDVGERRRLDVPEGSREQRGVDAAAIDEDQELSGEIVLESARADGPRRGVDALHLHPGHQPQRLGHGRESGAPDVLRRDHVDRRRGIRELLGSLRYGRHLERGQLLEVEVIEVEVRIIGRRERRHDQEQARKNLRHRIQNAPHPSLQVGPEGASDCGFAS
jgi:hypothetical protein